MNPFQKFQDALVAMYPGLSVFSDISWDKITKEYLAGHDERPHDVEEFVFGFPQFLQDKASREECPSHLFELAYFELIENELLNSDLVLPVEVGIHLNPSLSFLNLEFDICLMIDEATKGNIQIIPRPHILCLYRHPERGLLHIEINQEFLDVLQGLENGSFPSRQSAPEHQHKALNQLLEVGAVLEILKVQTHS